MRILVLILFCLGGPFASANGLWLRQAGPGEVNKIRFWVGWENGWNEGLSGNHDAAWLVAKNSTNQPFQHVRIVSVKVLEGGLSFYAKTSSDNMGFWIYGTENRFFERDSCLVEVQLESKSTSIRLYGIEMVYVPSGPFWAGDGASNQTFASVDKPDEPYRLGVVDSLVINRAGGIKCPEIAMNALVPYSFPAGTKGFFCQKYEISQEEWGEYLNALSLDEISDLYPNAGKELPAELRYKRSGFSRDVNGKFSTTTPYRAMGGLQWSDLLRYLNWLALRPLTELEFEKACRGTGLPIAKEFAWGTVYGQNPRAMQNDGGESERPAEELRGDSVGWANYAGLVGTPYLDGPARQGFAASKTSSRISAGAGFYGIFELSGNVWEMCVRLHPGNKAYTFEAGDGHVQLTGSIQRQWVQMIPIVRGGAHASVLLPNLTYPFRDLAVSDRFYYDYSCTERRSSTGGRGLRGW